MPTYLRPYFRLLFLAVALVSAPFPASASTIVVPVRVPASDVVVGNGEVSLGDDVPALLRETGQPALPYRIVSVVLPPFETVESVRVVPSGWETIAERFAPAGAPALLSTEGTPGKGDDLATASADGTVFPGTAGRYLSTGYLHGYAIASFAVFPVRVAKGDLQLAGDVSIEIQTKPDDGTSHVVRRERYRPDLEERVRTSIGRFVANPEAISSYGPAGVSAEKTRGGFQPTSFPSLEGSPVDYVIITNDSLASSWQALADWKTLRGVPTVVRTTEWIEANYQNGVDIQETIRTFVVDAYQKWGISYVLLGGDTHQIPARLGATSYFGKKDVPVDMYFGCVDGDWNSDHDNLFGEPGPSGDAPDLYQEVFVGRLPSANNFDVSVFINKIISYETPFDPDYMDRFLMLAEVLFPIDWDGMEPVQVDGANIANILEISALTDPSIDHSRQYENYTPYPLSFPETVGASLDSLEAGFNHVNHVGHGFRFNMSVGNGSIVNLDADQLTNTNRYSNLYLLNCTAVAYTYYCLAEHFLRNPVGGAVSCVGANESAFPIASQPYMNSYYYLLFEQGVHNIGQAFAESRLGRTAIAETGDNVEAWTHYIYSILADPEMTLWTGPVGNLNVSHMNSVGLGATSIELTVTDTGGPVAGAKVCLAKDEDDYQVGITDGSGIVSLPFTVETPGVIVVTVTSNRHAMHQSTILVSDPSTPYASYDGFAVDDDNAGGTAGNGDAVIDAGETVDLLPSVKNGGDIATGEMVLKLRSMSAGVTVIDSTASADSVAAGQSLAATDPFRVQFSPSIPDEATAEFTLVVEVAGVEVSRDQVKKIVHAPRLQPVVLRIDDSTLGNNDGVNQDGEEFLLFYRFKNFGTGAAVGLSMAITDLDTGFVFTDSTDTCPDAAPGESSENVAGMQIREPNTSVEHGLSLTVTDAYGRENEFTLELRRPDPPDSLAFDPRLGSDRLQIAWWGADSTDVATYNIYRSGSAGGPYTQVNVDPVHHSTYVDRGLSPTTRYYYVITSIDLAGNESAASIEGTASTNPNMIEGWPISMTAVTVSSPVVGDIDGDQDFEVVQGNEKLWAWHHDGVELRDPDNNAQTWGLFALEGNNFVAPCALAQMDTVPGFDIIAGSRDTKEIYVFRYTGEVLPGWPRAVEEGMRAGLVAGDLDNDGQKEVIALDESGVLYVWYADGSEFIDGDSDPLTDGVFRRFAGCTYQYGSPAIADIDGDGFDEIIVGTQGDSVYALNRDGSDVPGWPVFVGSDVSGSVAVGDIDGDGNLEVAVNVWDGWARVLNHDGSVLWSRWIKNYLSFAPSPALGDLDDDGDLETLIPGADGKLYAVTMNGGDLPGWPVVYSTTSWTESSPVIADINDDGTVDVVLGDETRFVGGWDYQGGGLPGFPLALDDALRATPTVADFDKDGDVDIIAAGWDKAVHVWDFPYMFNPHLVPWGGYSANLYNDGNIGRELPTGVLHATFQFAVGDGFVDLLWLLPPEAGYLFHVSRATVRDGEEEEFSRIASDIAVGADGLLRYVDADARRGEKYVYRIESAGDPAQTFTTTAVYIAVIRAELSQNYPNPFNPATTIEYLVPDGGGRNVSLIVYNVRGARVRTLVDKVQPGGRYRVQWDGRDNRGNQVSSGIYFYRLVQPGYTGTKKMILLK